jgi:hypothetical protein
MKTSSNVMHEGTVLGVASFSMMWGGIYLGRLG